MGSSSREEIATAFETLHAAMDEILRLSFDGLTTRERFTLLERLEHEARRLPVPGHELISQIGRQATPVEIGGKLTHALADRLRIPPQAGGAPTRADAKRRIDE
ncbi:MAG: DUF222 domain-containing protein, partial [Mycobacterium sp.]